MKKTLLLTLISATVILFASCDNDDDENRESHDSNYTYVDRPFSVSETKKVYFSTGNLQYHCKNRQFRFALKQYDNIGTDNAMVSPDYDGYVDLFVWGTWLEGGNPADTSSKTEGFVPDDTKKSTIGTEWKLLSKDEWTYLLTSRVNASDKRGVAEVSGVPGTVLLPDDWTLPEGLAFNSGYAEKHGADYYKTKNVYSADEWEKMEAAGAIFLPVTGGRIGPTLVEMDTTGYYWTSTVDSIGSPYYLTAVSVNSILFSLNKRVNARAVRFVHPYEE